MKRKDARDHPLPAKAAIAASRGNLLLCSIAFVVVQLLAYGTTLPPSVTGGDSGELLAVACQLGVAHPPGRHPS